MTSIAEQIQDLEQKARKVDELELENMALRLQVEKQQEIISQVKDDLRYLERFRALVERASVLASDIPGMREKIALLKANPNVTILGLDAKT